MFTGGSRFPGSRSHRGRGGAGGGGFTLVELLVVVAVIGVLLGVLLPTLSSATQAGRAAVCAANLRQCFMICRAYADDNAGLGPAVGQPYLSLPNWALVVQAGAGRGGVTPSELYAESSCLVCPQTLVNAGQPMTRTYAMNATGHAGAPGDADNYDAPPPAGSAPVAIRFDKVVRPSGTALLVDSSAPPQGPGQPPATRTSSVIDFRNPAHTPSRLGFVHSGARAFNACRFDGSGEQYRAVEASWLTPLP